MILYKAYMERYLIFHMMSSDWKNAILISKSFFELKNKTWKNPENKYLRVSKVLNSKQNLGIGGQKLFYRKYSREILWNVLSPLTWRLITPSHKDESLSRSFTYRTLSGDVSEFFPHLLNQSDTKEDLIAKH